MCYRGKRSQCIRSKSPRPSCCEARALTSASQLWHTDLSHPHWKSYFGPLQTKWKLSAVVLSPTNNKTSIFLFILWSRQWIKETHLMWNCWNYHWVYSDGDRAQGIWTNQCALLPWLLFISFQVFPPRFFKHTSYLSYSKQIYASSTGKCIWRRSHQWWV